MATEQGVGLTDVGGLTALFGFQAGFSQEAVNVETALGVPAVWACIDVISSTIAALPITVHRKTGDGQSERVADNDALQYLLNDEVNDDLMASAEFRRLVLTRYLTEGRALIWVEKNKAGRVTNLWPLDWQDVEVRLDGHRRTYIERNAKPGKAPRVWKAEEIIDLIWFPGDKSGEHRNPIHVHRNTIGQAIAMDRYAARAFKNGGLPSVWMETPENTAPAIVQNAAKGVNAAIETGVSVLPLFGGMKLHEMGGKPADMQLPDARRANAIDICRVYRMPPTMIQSLENGTYSNTEQLYLQFRTLTIQPVVEQLEELFNSKLFGRSNRTHFVKFDLNSLVRSDMKSRYEALRVAVYGGLMTPNEAREPEGLPAMEGGDQLLIQGATIPLTMAGKIAPKPVPKADDLDEDPNTETDPADSGEPKE